MTTIATRNRMATVLRAEYGYLFKQGFLLQGIHKMYFLVLLDLPNEKDLLLDPSALPNCNNWNQ